jgi:hypothetical protein
MYGRRAEMRALALAASVSYCFGFWVVWPPKKAA